MTRYDLYWTGLIFCITIILWERKRIWFYNKARTKFIIIYFIGFLTMLLALTLPSVSAWNWCEKEGYQYCVEQTETINETKLTSKIAINLYDTTGEAYDTFLYRGFAIGEFYADVYHEGEEIFYIPNLTNWNETCDNETMSCKGTKINQTTAKATYTLGKLHDEYKECPLFISLKCHDKAEWCEWAGVGWLKKPNASGCVHIRVTECFFDEDCQQKEYCDKTNKYDWKNWTCKEIPPNTTITRTEREPTGYTAKPSGGGYSPEYTIKDIAPSFWDMIVKIIKGIGRWFG